MRIALVVPGGVDRSGDRKVIPSILWLIERLARHHDVHVVVPFQEPTEGSWPLRGATVHNVAARFWRIQAVQTLLHLHLAAPLDVVHAIWARGAGEVALSGARMCGCPVVVHVMGGELVWMPDVPFGTRRPWHRALVRQVIRRADKVTAASGPMVDAIRALGVEATHVRLGVDAGVWRPTPPRPHPDGEPFRVVHVGSVTPVKDQATLVRAAALLTRDGVDVRVDLVGEDTEHGSMQTLAAQLGIADRVTVHGFLTQEQTIPVVRAADLMAVTSRHEAGPVAMLEAAAVGVPTVGTPVGHVAEWAPAAAVAFPHGDAAALARAIILLAADDDGRIVLARRAQTAALAHDADWTAARFEAIYEELVDRRARRLGRGHPADPRTSPHP